MEQQRPPPRVTVRDPSRPERHADVLELGSDEPPGPSPFTPRRRKALAAVALVVAAAVVVAELRERQAVAAEQRRLDRIVDLAVEPRGTTTGYDTATGRATLELQVRLLNRGPRALAVERGVLGSYRLVQELPEVESGSFIALTLRKEVACSPTAPPPVEELRSLELTLRTAAGPRQVSLPVELLRDDAARACGFLPIEEAVDIITVRGGAATASGLRLGVDVASRSVRRISLTGVDAGPGLAVQVGVGDDGPARLPLTLLSRTPNGVPTLTLELRVTVTDCRAAETARPQLALGFTDDRGRVAQPLVGYEPGLLTSLLAGSCSG